MDELRRQNEKLLGRMAALERENSKLRKRCDELHACNADLEERNAQLEAELKRRGKKYRPQANTKKVKTPDRRKPPHRKHPGIFREPPVLDENTIHRNVRLDCCPHCGRRELDETGWCIDGKNVWCWCFCNPRLALFLIDHHRSAAHS